MKLIYTIFPIILLSCGLKANQNASPQAEEDGKVKSYPSGFELTYFVDAETPNPADGDIFYINLINQVGDSVLFDSKKMIGNPAPISIMPPRYSGDIQEVLKDLSLGDSVMATIPADSFMRGRKPEFIEDGAMVTLYLTIVDHKTQKQIQEEQAKYEAEQKMKDEKVLSAFFEKNGIQAKQAPSGYYYVITQAGDGPKPTSGQKVTVNYTGHNLEGVVFDSNVDPKFNHVQPFEFAVGQGQVIKGWDLAFLNLNQGSKATIYIPSYLAYGANPPAGAPFGPNESLIFDIELVSIK